MGIDYSYNCTNAVAKRTIGVYGDKTAILCDLEFVDEHGHQLAPVVDALVVVEGNSADVEQYPENICGLDADEDTIASLGVLCGNYPGYNVYNPEELAAMLVRASA